MVSRSRPRLRVVSGQLAELDHPAELGQLVESRGWRIGGWPVRLFVWRPGELAGRPPADAQWSESLNAWLAPRAV